MERSVEKRHSVSALTLIALLGLIAECRNTSYPSDQYQDFSNRSAFVESIDHADRARAENAYRQLQSLTGIPYIDFGFRTSAGDWVQWTGQQPHFTQSVGYNCSGFVFDAVREIYDQPWSLEQLSAPRNNPQDPFDQSADRRAFGYEVMKNISDLVGGRQVMTNGYVEHIGYQAQNYHELTASMRVGNVYVLDVVKNGQTDERLDFHVAIALPRATGIHVFESTAYPAQGQFVGSSELPLDAFLAKYEGPKYSVLAEELPLD